MSFTMVSVGKEVLGGGLTATGQTGYVSHSREDIAKLCEQIEAPHIGLDTRSIPDVWAQLLKFHQTLTGFDTENEQASGHSRAAFARVRLRWRALIALVALRRELGIDALLKLQRVFPEDRARAAHGKFAHVAQTLLPDSFSDIEYGWRDIHLITLHGVTLGCTSPLTFVCPAASNPSALTSNEVPWIRNGEFLDPLPGLTGPFLHCLSDWLRFASEQLRPGLADSRYRAGIHADELRRELNAFQSDLHTRLAASQSSGSYQVRDEHDPHFAASGLVQQCLQRVFFTSTVVTAEQAKASVFRLLPDTDEAGLKPLLLIGPSFRKLPGFEDGNIEVLKGITLNQALESYKPGDHRRIKTLNFDVCEIYSTDEVFCDRLYVVRTTNAFPGAYLHPTVASLERRGQDDPIIPLLPLRSEFLRYFSPTYLRDNVEFRGSDAEIQVTLRVRLNPAGPGSRPIALTRTYRTSDGSMVETLPPEVRIWPQYSEKDLPGWKIWYAYYNDLSQPGNKLLVSPYGQYAQSAPIDIVDPKDKHKKVEITPCAQFPAAFVCRQNGAEAGILLAEPVPLSRSERSDAYDIGIDFGTTGTAVYFAKNGSEVPTRMELPPHLLALSTWGSSETYRFFLPTATENTNGILSLFRDLRNTPKREGGGIRPILDGHISFLSQAGSAKPKEDPTNDGLFADMKWGDAAEQARAVAFLEQLCLMTALQVRVEGGMHARWAFSYPLSFSPERRANFRTHWENSVQYALERSGLAPFGDSDGMRFRNESVCAAKYARRVNKADLGGGAIVLDIGGGSSDISLWRRQGTEPRPIYNSSVNFAGRDLLQHAIWSRPEVLKLLATTKEGIALAHSLASNEALRRSKSLFYSQIDVLFKQEGKELLSTTLPKLAGERDFKDFVGILNLGLSGLFFYTGLLLRDLAQQGRLDPRLPDVFVCGNGGKILQWLAFGKFRAGEPAEHALLTALLAGTGFPAQARGNAKIDLSKEPKSEAAYGLLIDPDEPERLQDNPPRIIAGEQFFLEKQAFDPLAVVPYDDFHTEPFSVSENPPMLQEFIKATGRRPLPARTVQDVVAETNEELAAIARDRLTLERDEKDALRERAQPIFIVLLKQLIRTAAASWAAGETAWWL